MCFKSIWVEIVFTNSLAIPFHYKNTRTFKHLSKRYIVFIKLHIQLLSQTNNTLFLSFCHRSDRFLYFWSNQFRCNNQNTKQFYIFQNTYDLPDQIWDILSVPGGWSHANEKIFKNYNEVKKTMAASAGISVGFKYGMFSASGSYTKMQHTLTRTSQYIEEVSAYDAALKIDFLPAFDLKTSRYFKHFIGRLSTSFTSNPSSYFRFIRYFGTHYFTSGNFGGAIKLHIETKSSYYDGKTTRDVRAQAKASFLSLVKIRGSGSSSSSRIDRNFKKSSTESLK